MNVDVVVDDMVMDVIVDVAAVVDLNDDADLDDAIR